MATLNTLPSGLSTDKDLRISSVGIANFDYEDTHSNRISPRKVTEMHYYSEQAGDQDDWIVLKVTDPAHDANVWVRFQPDSEGYLGDFALDHELAMPGDAALRASLRFDNSIEYKDAIETRSAVFKQCKGAGAEAGSTLCASRYAEMLSLRIGQGVGSCTPQDLCEIWPALPDSDRRLHAFYWYEKTDFSGIEYIILHVVGSSSYTQTGQNWWVRLERDGSQATDEAVISKNRRLVELSESKQTRAIVFRDGIPFYNVIQVLQGIPTGFDVTTEDCWYYSSTLAHRLSAEVGDDQFECPTEDLAEIWSGERGAQLFVNRIQWFQDGEGPDYLVLNISATKHDGHGLWVRLGQDPMIGSLVDTACVTRNRRNLLRSGPLMNADITFSTLRFGKVKQVLGQLNRELGNMLSFDVSLLYAVLRKRELITRQFQENQVSKAVMTLRRLTEMQDIDCYWVDGDSTLLSDSLSQLQF
ncbi:hypothetical protein FRC09_000540 [Ceratobasidium sp. 395]|nr:hypothetical protein FRC09_000540 [Ceratobasidium sp. 395]